MATFAIMLQDATRLTVDPYVIDSLMPDLVGHDRQPSASIVYLRLWRLTGSGRSGVRIALADIAESCGLSKRAVQDALRWLTKRKPVEIERENITAI